MFVYRMTASDKCIIIWIVIHSCFAFYQFNALSSVLSPGAVEMVRSKPQSLHKGRLKPKRYTPNAVVELLPHRRCVGANLIAP